MIVDDLELDRDAEHGQTGNQSDDYPALPVAGGDGPQLHV